MFQDTPKFRIVERFGCKSLRCFKMRLINRKFFQYRSFHISQNCIICEIAVDYFCIEPLNIMNRRRGWKLLSICGDSFEAMKPKTCCKSPLSKKFFKPGVVLIEIRWLMVSTEKSLNFVEVAEKRPTEYLCKHRRDNRFYCWVVARRKFVFFSIYNFPTFWDTNSKISFRDIEKFRGETNFSQSHIPLSLQIYLIGWKFVEDASVFWG